MLSQLEVALKEVGELPDRKLKLRMVISWSKLYVFFSTSSPQLESEDLWKIRRIYAGLVGSMP